MLKPENPYTQPQVDAQPPSGGCVLKRSLQALNDISTRQPPSGGCVLKPHHPRRHQPTERAAAFRRLCVETTDKSPDLSRSLSQPPSGGCVLKPKFVLLI